MAVSTDNIDLKTGFRMGDWVIQPLSGVFKSGGHTLHVEPKVMDVLVCLADAGGEVVTRDELLECVWGGTVVTDEVLTRCVSELRTLLGDTARERRYIRTIPKRGYALLVPVNDPASFHLPQEKHQIVHSGKQEHSIAVLPFTDLSPASDNQYFSDGLTEELINALTQIKELRVAARTSTFSFKGKDMEIRDIGARLNVKHILEGSVRMADDKLRITAQLVNVEDGFQLWSETFERECKGIFSIQEEIARAVADKLKIKLGVSNGQKMLNKGTTNLEAYKWYLRGKQKYHSEQPGLLYTGAKELKKAVDIDSNFADAHGLLAYVNSMCAGIETYASMADCIRDSYQHALKLDPIQPEALMAKAIDVRWQTWDWGEVQVLFEQALTACPNNPHVLTQYAKRFYRDVGNYAKAEELLWRAVDLDPLNEGARSSLCYVLRYAEKFTQAIEQAELAIRLSPQYGFAHFGLVLALISDKQFEHATAALQHAESFLGERHPIVLQCKGRLYANMGDRERALEIKRQLVELSNGPEKQQYMCSAGWVCVALDELEEAIYWLEKTLATTQSQVIVARASINTINNNVPTYRDTPEFQAFLKKMNLDDESVKQFQD